jgi:hypothetical protein
VASRGATSCAGAPVLHTPFRLPPFNSIFLQVLPTLNTKVVKKVTLSNNAKGSIGFYSLV